MYSIQPTNENRSPTKHTQAIINTAFPVYVSMHTVQPLVQHIVHTIPKMAKRKGIERKTEKDKERSKEIEKE